jgi:hypothetical protein
MKNSFIMYLDSLDVLDELTDDQAGKLFKAIRKIQKGEPNPELDFGLKMALLPFKIQFERDNKKYNAICERNRNNGKKGGRPKNPENPVGYLETQKTQTNPDKPKKADSDSDSDSEKEEKKKKKYIKKNPVLLAEHFYMTELQKASNVLIKDERDDSLKKYEMFVKFILGNNTTGEKFTGVLSIPNQINFDSFRKLNQKAKEYKTDIFQKICAIENTEKYYKGKKSLYLTLLNFIKPKSYE